MSHLETEKKRLATYKKRRTALFRKIKENYGLEDESLEDLTYGELEWEEYRDLKYADDMVMFQTRVVRALELSEEKENEALRNADPYFEQDVDLFEFGFLAREARRIQKERADDMKQAQSVIDALEEIAKTCDELRK